MFPASAGMNRTQTPDKRLTTNVPRKRGDEPSWADYEQHGNHVPRAFSWACTRLTWQRYRWLMGGFSNGWPDFEAKVRPLRKVMLALRKLGFSGPEISAMSESQAYSEVISPQEGRQKTY